MFSLSNVFSFNFFFFLIYTLFHSCLLMELSLSFSYDTEQFSAVLIIGLGYQIR